MAVITLTTDWRSNDFYVGAVKGAILSLHSNATIIDLNHQIQTFNTAQAAFVLRNSFFYFPKGSIHILDVNSEATAEAAHIVMMHKEHFFIGADNGAFGLICRDEPEAIVQLEAAGIDDCQSFAALHVFAPAAAYLSMGHPMADLGTLQTNIARQTPIRASYDEAVITGNVIYIDSYQNAITNVSRELFDRIGKGRRFEILVQSNHYRIGRINKTYSETSVGELLALFNTLGLLEIAINKGNVAELLNLGINANVRIKFFE